MARRNGQLTRSALVLGNDGRLELACRLFVHERLGSWAARWAQILLADQFIAARELSDQMDHLGTAPNCSHPVSGVRPRPDELFGVRPTIAEASANVRASLVAVVPLVAVPAQYVVPFELEMAPSGALSFCWRPSGGTRTDVQADPVVRVEIHVRDAGLGPGWVVTSRLPVQGDTAAKACWCNDRNAVLLADSAVDDQTVMSGWGLTESGDCCLSSWISPHIAADHELVAAPMLANILRYHQAIVLAAITAEPAAIISNPPSASGLAAGLASMLETAVAMLNVPGDYDCTVEERLAGAAVTLTRPSSLRGSPDGAVPPLAAAVPGADGMEFRTRVHVPLTRNSVEFSLVFAALFAASTVRFTSWSDTSQDLLPGEHPDIAITERQLDHMRARLADEGLLMHRDDVGWSFKAFRDVGQFRAEPADASPLNCSAALKLSGSVTTPNLYMDKYQQASADEEALGSWVKRRSGVAYEVVVPSTYLIWPSEGLLIDMLTALARRVIRTASGDSLGGGITG